MQERAEVYFIDNAVQEEALDFGACVDFMEQAYRQWGMGDAAIIPKATLTIFNGEDSRYNFTTMQGGTVETGIVAIRIKSDFFPRITEAPELTYGDKQAGKEGQFCGLVLVFDARSGLPVAMMNDAYIQHARVAAGAAVAARYLARPNAEVLGILGSQGMAHSHAFAINAVRPIRLIKVYSPNPEHRKAFAQEMREKLEVEVQAEESPEAVVRGSDIVACCTRPGMYSRAPVLKGEWLEQGTLVTMVLPPEIGRDTLARVDYTVTNQPFRDLALFNVRAGASPGGGRGSGLNWEELTTDETSLLSDVVAGKARGRANDKEITFFNNNEGTGVQFAATGAAILAALKKRDFAGVNSVPLSWFVQDVRD